MCEYLTRKQLIEPRNVIEEWIKKVQKDLKKEAGITFAFTPMGSVSRGMVVRKCNEHYFDFDYKLVLQNVPDILVNDCKRIKSLFCCSFDKNKPHGFSDCKDRSQALRSRNSSLGYGLDVVIFIESKGKQYILFNNKNSNGANGKDYQWQVRPEMEKYYERLAKVNGPEMWGFLRNIYLEKRHRHKDDDDPAKKASYQLFNEAVVETLRFFKIPL